MVLPSLLELLVICTAGTPEGIRLGIPAISRFIFPSGREIVKRRA